MDILLEEMLKLSVDVKNIDKEKLKDHYKRILMKSMFKMEELAVDYAPFDQGYLRENITVFPQILSSNYVLNSNASYSAAMEYGSRPFYAPIKPLKEWARRKIGDENIGYAVQAKIAKSGIRAQPYMRPSLSIVKTYWMPLYMKEEFAV